MIVPKQPPPNLLAPYPAIKALNHPGITISFFTPFKKLCHLTFSTGYKPAVNIEQMEKWLG